MLPREYRICTPSFLASGTTISWAEKTDTGNNVVVSGDTVTVTRPSSAEGDKTITLTATISKAGGTSETKDIDVVVKAYTEAEEANTAIAADKAALDATDFTYSGSDDKDNVTQDFTLPTAGASGTTISWVEKTDTGNNVVVSGDTATVTRPSNAEGDKTVTLTATISKAGGTSETKDIEIVVIASAPTYSVTYDSNGAIGGSAPTDGNNYEQETSVTVLGNTGNLAKTGYRFIGWNTQADGSGMDITAASTYTMGASNITFFAKWIANADLSNVDLSNGVLTPNFDKNIMNYSASVAYNTSMITVAATLDALSGSITVNGIPVNSGQSSNTIALVEGNNTITVVTTAIDNTTQKTYIFTITREANVNQNVLTGDLSGSVTDGTNPLADALVRIMKGGTNGTQYGQTLITNAQGEFTFSNLPYGTYSLVGTKGDGIITKAIIIESSTTTQNLEMPTGKQKTVVEVGDDTASAAASNLDEMFTAADTAIIAGGGEVVLKLVIDQKNQGEVAADAALIQGALQSGSTVGAYFDINMRRTVTGSGGSDVNDELVQPPAGKSVLITVDVPVPLRNKAPYQVIRVHNGTTAVIPATYNSTLHTLTFAGDLFSVYSIVYTAPTSRGSRSSSSSSKSLADKTIALVGDTRITPAVAIDINSEDEIEITLKDTLKDIVKDDVKGSDVIVPINKSVDRITINLSGDTIDTLADKESNIVIETPSGSATLSASDFNLDEFNNDDGNPIASNEIKVSITITMSGKTDSELAALSNKLGVELVLPLSTIDVTLDNGDMSMKLDQMNDYVTQKLQVPEGIAETKISTAVFIDNKGKMNHVPTQISIINNKYFAIVNSLYLGTEAYFIWNPIQLQQAENHWAEKTVNNLASRLVLTNTEAFEPNKAITRADFAEYIIRALGIYREDLNIDNKFSDVNKLSAQAYAILIANKYGIVKGYSDGTFRPDTLITREEAMTMYQRAMKVTKLTGSDPNRYKDYKDFEEVSHWATYSVKDVLAAHVFNGTSIVTISPKLNITYAEAAQAIKNLLVESRLINN